MHKFRMHAILYHFGKSVLADERSEQSGKRKATSSRTEKAVGGICYLYYNISRRIA